MARYSQTKYERTFKEAVPKSFASLITGYGFSLTQTENWKFELTSQQCVLEIYLDRTDVLVFAKPVRIEQVPKPRVGIPMSFNIKEVINYLYPDVGFEYKRISTPEDIQPESDRLVELLRQYCTSILQGDFSIWPKLLERRRRSI